MKRLVVLFLSLFVVIGLSACDGETTEKEIGTVSSGDENQSEQEEESNDVDDAEENASENEDQESESNSYDEVLLDDEVATVTLKSIETVADDIFGDEHKIKLDIENKSDKTIVVQSDQVSIDGLMVDDMAIFSETVAGGKRANGSLDIMSFDEELPELNENLEFILIVIDEETFDRISETDISVDLK
ncbi:MAG TPA: hypothetical protein GXZ58_08280 [Bacilli bacterium]|nr:hypothetical protein [Bacilli bacterium]